MASSKSISFLELLEMPSLWPEDVQTWFPPALQQRYVNHILMQSESLGEICVTLTNTQAEHLVRLWGYAYIKHYGAAYIPIKTLVCRVNSFFCSHREMAKLFYADRKAGGSARSAGLMLRKLESMRLIQCKSVKGSYTKISINLPLAFELIEEFDDEKIFPDNFDPRKDAPTVANFLKPLFHYDTEVSQTRGRDITKALRTWSKQYPDGVRVLRHIQNQKPVAIVSIFPVHPDSEFRFDLPPRESLFILNIHKVDQDPIQCAAPGISGCCIAYMNCWHIKSGFWSYKTVIQLQNEAKSILQKIRQDYPDLSDLYSVILHPHHEDFAAKVGFEIMQSDAAVFQHWVYIALDHFIESDSEELFRDIDFEPYNRLI